MRDNQIRSLSVRRRPAKPDQAPKRTSSGRRKAKAVLDKPAMPSGWDTSDDQEIALRRWRGTTEILSIKALESGHPYFGAFRAQSVSGGSYEVEIRSLTELANSCGCIDHRVNGLGTCKHIEGTLATMARGRARSFRGAKASGSPRIEVFLDRRTTPPKPAVAWPAESEGRNFKPARDWLGRWLQADGTLIGDPRQVAGLIAAWEKAPPRVSGMMRVSRHFTAWLDRAARERRRVEARAAFSPTRWDWARPFRALPRVFCWRS